jgi:uncharacterized damage-inducible protein DinB
MSPEQCKLIADYTLATYERERALTRNVIAAIPPGQEHYRPHPASQAALELAFHIASSERFFLNGATTGEFQYGSGGLPEQIKTARDVLAWYEENVPPALAAAQAMTPEEAARVVDFRGLMRSPAITFLGLMVRHSAHHRGQLSTYLRPMGAKVPGIYGPSGDKE